MFNIYLDLFAFVKMVYIIMFFIHCYCYWQLFLVIVLFYVYLCSKIYPEGWWYEKM